MEGVEVQPHTRLSKAQTTPVVIVVGDPARAKLLAEMCQESEELAYNREYRSFKCCKDGITFLVVSHGVGSAGCAVCFEELIHNGAQVIIRAGTAGSLYPELYHQGDLVVCHSAVREDGVSRLLVPLGYPAIADPGIHTTLLNLATKTATTVSVTEGMTLTSDVFYASTVLPSALETYRKAGVDVVEMEIATLFVLCRLKGVKAGAIVCLDGSPFSWSSGDYDPTGEKFSSGRAFMLETVISAAVKLTTQLQSGELKPAVKKSGSAFTAAAVGVQKHANNKSEERPSE